MIAVAKNIYDYRELLQLLVWKNITLRYKQSHLGVLWLVLRPLMLVGIFMVVRSFVGSVVSHANLVKKIYFPREIFPLASVFAVSVQLGIGLVILALMMLWCHLPAGPGAPHPAR